MLAEGPGRGGEELLDELSPAAECSEFAKQLLTLAGEDGKHTLAHTRACIKQWSGPIKGCATLPPQPYRK